MPETTGRETVVRNRFSRSIGSGISSLTSGGREYFVLEHKSNSKRYRAGQQKEIIVDYVELGRDSKCAIRYSPEDVTVSRRHAAITKEGGTWVVLNLSETNPTLLNGRPVNKKYYLSSGDEIQLSLEGPKVAFIVPGNNKTGSLSIGKRMTLFSEQALKPYKRAIAGLIALVVAISALAGYFIYDLNKQNINLQTQATEIKKQLRDSVSISQERADTLEKMNLKLAQESEKAKRRVRGLRNELRKVNEERRGAQAPTIPGTSAPANSNIEALYKDVYLVRVSRVKVTQPDGEILRPDNLVWQGTGFLTKDNRFVTARHVIEPWFYPLDADENPDMLLLNVLRHNYGGTINLEVEAISSTGKKLKFELTDFEIDRTGDKSQEVDVEGQPHVIRHALENPNDIAWAKINQEGSLLTDPGSSDRLQATRDLYILGYPLGFGASDPGTQMAPIYSTAKVGRPGLENSSIITSNNSIESGNSGGPVFIYEDGKYKVIGVVSGGWGEEVGRIIPIKLIY